MPTTPDPYCLLAELTYRCPLACPYCSNPLQWSRFDNELDTGTWKRVLREAAELGVVQVHFSGGEPMVRRDLPELVEQARDVDLYSHLSTSATLADERSLSRLRASGLDAIQISLQDAREEASDWIAGGTSFRKKQAAVACARQLGFPVTLNVVLHRHNLATGSNWLIPSTPVGHSGTERRCCRLASSSTRRSTSWRPPASKWETGSRSCTSCPTTSRTIRSPA